jgi:hypothetical protein
VCRHDAVRGRAAVRHGVIRRRLLINFRVEPSVVQRLLPPPFRPKLHQGHAVAGICLIRLENIRPRHLPSFLGLSSENAAHRIAVVWNDASGLREGVFIPRRDSGSLMNQLAGGRLFPGEHHRSAFEIHEENDRIALHMRAADGQVQVDVVGRVAADLPPTSSFATLSDASAFFEPGSLGYSVTAGGSRLDGVVLETHAWSVEPLAIEHVYSSYFADAALFPTGSVTFDCGLIMRNIAHEWHAATDMYV